MFGFIKDRRFDPVNLELLNAPEIEPENKDEKDEKNEINLIFTRLVSSYEILGKLYDELPC